MGIPTILLGMAQSVHTVDPIIQHHQYLHRIQPLKDRLALQIPSLRIEQHPVEETLHMVIQVDVLQRCHALALPASLADMLEKDSHQDLYLSSNLLPQSLPAERNETSQALHQLSCLALSQQPPCLHLSQSLPRDLNRRKPYKITGNILKQGHLGRAIVGQFMQSRLLGLVCAVILELGPRRSPQRHAVHYCFWIVARLIQISSREGFLPPLRASSTAIGGYEGGSVHERRLPGPSPLVFGLGLDDLSGWLHDSLCTFPSCFCLTWVKSAAQLKQPLPQGQMKSRDRSLSWHPNMAIQLDFYQQQIYQQLYAQLSKNPEGKIRFTRQRSPRRRASRRMPCFDGQAFWFSSWRKLPWIGCDQAV